MIAVTNGANSRIELSAKRNCWTNSVPYGYGGRIADMIVLPVRIIMSPTCSSRFFVGKNALSATDRTTQLLLPMAAASERYPIKNARHKGELALRPPKRWYVAPALRGMYALFAPVLAVLALAGCGGNNERQDKNEPKGD